MFGSMVLAAAAPAAGGGGGGPACPEFLICGSGEVPEVFWNLGAVCELAE